MDIKEFVKNFSVVTKNLIERYEKDFKDLSGVERKLRLDDAIVNYVEGVVDNIGVNFLLKFALKKLLIKNIPSITQAIYDLIEVNVEGITKA